MRPREDRECFRRRLEVPPLRIRASQMAVQQARSAVVQERHMARERHAVDARHERAERVRVDERGERRRIVLGEVLRHVHGGIS